MSLLNISDNQSQPQSSFALLQLAFRPFFLGAGLSAVILMVLWLFSLNTSLQNQYYNPTLWHAHEMLFGYTAAIIVGFLLTAIRNWTGVQTIQHAPLGLLALLWLAGRILPWSVAPDIMIASIDLLFLPCAALAAAWPILKIKQYKNLVFIPILLVLAMANLLIHLEVLGITQTAMQGARLATATIMLLIVIMGSRVIPFFIKNGAQLAAPFPLYELKKLHLGANALMILWIMAYSFFPMSIITAYLALTVGILLLIRLLTWHHLKLWKIPMLWILFIGFSFIPFGLILKFMAYYLPQLASFATHTFTAGAIGVLTLGMVSRVSLGHSGRGIQHNKLILISFYCIVLAALVRISPILPFLLSYTETIYLISGVLWISAFVFFLMYFAKILWIPRADGQPG